MRESLREYEAEVMREIAEEALAEDLVTSQFELREFVSYRAYGRRRKRPKDIRLVRDRKSGRVQTLRDIPTGRLDTLAEVLLAGMLPAGANAFEEFVARLENKARSRNGRNK